MHHGCGRQIGGRDGERNLQARRLSPVHSRPQVQTSQGWATVAHVTVNHASLAAISNPSVAFNEGVAAALDAVERTEGVVLTTFSGNLIVSWNHRKCDSLLQAMRFAGWVVQARNRSSLLQGAKVGISTGGVLHCHPGRTVRFVTLVGQCVELAGSMAAAAAQLHTDALVALLEGPIGLKEEWVHIVRPIDVVAVAGVETAQIYELRPLECLNSKFGNFFLDSDVSAAQIGWSAEYAAAYKRRDAEWIRQHIVDDTVASQVAEMLETGSHLVPHVLPGFMLSHYEPSVSLGLSIRSNADNRPPVEAWRGEG
eukprot:Sspe_Gene.98750::Locus_72151_Transcript_1_1_Confidence_1.000_Length_1629::g.98750::m.98750